MLIDHCTRFVDLDLRLPRVVIGLLEESERTLRRVACIAQSRLCVVAGLRPVLHFI